MLARAACPPEAEAAPQCSVLRLLHSRVCHIITCTLAAIIVSREELGAGVTTHFCRESTVF